MDVYMIDPPEGWKYGFPRPIPKDQLLRAREWLIENGYPKEKIHEQYKEKFYYRTWPVPTVRTYNPDHEIVLQQDDAFAAADLIWELRDQVNDLYELNYTTPSDFRRIDDIVDELIKIFKMKRYEDSESREIRSVNSGGDTEKS